MRRVLVIDDQADVRAMIALILRVNRFEVVQAPDAVEGLQAFIGSSFDLVIVDIFLHGVNGFELIRTIRERIAGIPIIAISGMTVLDFIARTPELSDVVRLHKPFRPNQLVKAIDTAFASARACAQMFAGPV